MKRAVLIGIDRYDHFGPLEGCEKDVLRLHPLLARNFDDLPNFECRSLISGTEYVTRKKILQAVDTLLAPGGDVSLLYFAGHGRATQSSVVLVSQDGDGVDPGVSASHIFEKIAESSVREVIVILDCCFSGAAGSVPQLMGRVSALRDGTCLLAASRHDQSAHESAGGHGMFSGYLADALEGGAADVFGEVSLAGLYAFISQGFGAFEQRPICKMNVDRSHQLRRCAPAMPLPELWRLPIIFPDPDADLPLDPSYERTAGLRNAEHEEIFKLLHRYRAAKLLIPVGAEHLYFAAMQSGACRLTALGKHCWRVADRQLVRRGATAPADV
jgi:hypothetical protein